MSEYALSRTRSAAIVRSNSLASRPTVLLQRTYSVPDLTSYISTSPRYRPQWPNYYSNVSYAYPYRYYRDWSLYDSYWYDRAHYFSPLYHTNFFPRRYYYSDYVFNPYYSNVYGSTYWPRYSSNYYSYPYTYSRPWTSWTRSSYFYSPYRSYLYDCNATSVDSALEQYRNGLLSFSALKHGCLARNSWDQRFKDWRRLYTWNGELPYEPATFARPTLQYFTQWS